MRHVTSLVVLVGLALLSAFFMASAYGRARDEAIEQLTAQERILAEQAAQSISSYFTYYRQTLEFLASNAEVASASPSGQQLLRELFKSERADLLSLTRVGPDGRILFTHPEEHATGRYILDQPHVREVFARRRPVVSQVFRAVQGYDCVALHVPVFDGERFAGSLAALVPFDRISKRFLEGVRIGQSGHCVLLSREGIELYCPLPGHTGRSTEVANVDSAGARQAAARMVNGETGTATYDHRPAGAGAGVQRQHIYFTKIPLEDTFWSVAVIASESEALAFIQGFRNRWLIGLGLAFVAFVAWGVVLTRAYLQLEREKSRQATQERMLAAEREHERALRQSEERFRTYFQESLLAMAITSPAKGWLVVNDRLTHLLGYTREELLASDWVQLTHEDDVAADVAQFGRMLAGDFDGYSLEKRFRHKDGSIVHTILSVRLVRRADGSPDFCLTQLQDITDRKRLDEERARLGEQLRQAQKLEAVGQLAGGIAHDYNNLLTVQLGHLSMLRDDPSLPPEVRAPLVEVEKSAVMAAQLTRQLLAFGRRQVLQVSRLDLNETVRSVTELLRRVLPESITLDVRPASQPMWVDADAGSLEQVLMNLALNARDAMPSGGRLTVNTALVTPDPNAQSRHPDARPGTFVRLEVADTGKGMSVDVRARIFEPFFTTKEPGQGTGLGLATVHGIVRQHRGWIDVETAEGRGSAFRVHLESAPPPGAPDVPRTTAELDGGPECVLVAEDNEAVRTMLAKMLRRLNCRVLVAASAEEARRLWSAHAQEVSLLLSDMMMVDGESGLDLAHALRRERPDLRVVIMSGYSQELVGAGLVGDMAFLAKPWTQEALAQTISGVLRRP
jgi:PAS domain S-box-containing protein